MYKLLKHTSITSFDVDNTLVMWEDYRVPGNGKLTFTYGDETIYLKPHYFHPLFVKHCFDRGDYVEIWSQNGYQWAEQVVIALGLSEYVHVVRNKPTRHVDDKVNLTDIVGTRIYLDEEGHNS